MRLVYRVSNPTIMTRYDRALCPYTPTKTDFRCVVVRADHLLLDPAWVRLRYHLRHSLIMFEVSYFFGLRS